MPVLAALWLALLHLVAAPAPRPGGVAASPVRATEATLSRPAATHDTALRAPRPLPGLGVVRPGAPRPPAPPPQGATAAALPPSVTVAPVADARTASAPTHAPSARALLAYYPTAPPLQG